MLLVRRHHTATITSHQSQTADSAPPCCHLGSYIKRLKSSLVHPLACNWYYCAQFIAKPKAACALRFSWAATSSNLGLSANLASSVKPEVHNVSLRHQNRIEPRPYVTCTRNLVKIGRVIPKICSQTDKHTHTDRQTRSSQYSALTYQGRSNNICYCF